jgi:hypothetical protein
LVVVGVTNEAEDLVKNYVRQNGIEYPIAIEKSYASSEALGISGYPSAVLIDAKGKVVWEGHPGGLANKVIEKALAGAKPPGVPDALKPAAKALDNEEFGKAWEIIKKLVAESTLKPEDKQLADSLIASIEAEAKRLYEASLAQIGQKEYFLAVSGLERVGNHYQGVHETEAALAKAKELRADPALGRELDGGERLEVARQHESARNYAKAAQVYKEVTAKYKGTHAAETAAKAAEAVRPMIGFDADCKACTERATSACPKHRKR